MVVWPSHHGLQGAGERQRVESFIYFFLLTLCPAVSFFVCVCVCVCVCDCVYMCVSHRGRSDVVVVCCSSSVFFSGQDTSSCLCVSEWALCVLFCFFLVPSRGPTPSRCFTFSPARLESCVFLSVRSNKGQPPPCTAPRLRSWRGWAECTSTTASAACRPSRLRTRAALPACGSWASGSLQRGLQAYRPSDGQRRRRRRRRRRRGTSQIKEEGWQVTVMSS